MTTVYNKFRETERNVSTQAFLHIPHQATREYHQGPVDYTYSQALRAVNSLE